MPRPVKFAIIGCILIFIASLGYAIYRQENYKSTFVRNVEREMDPQTQFVLQSKVMEINSELDNTTDAEAKVKLLRDKASILRELGMLEDAEQSLRDATGIASNNAGVYTDLFDLQVEMKNYKGAERSIKRAIELNPAGSRIKKYVDFSRAHLGATEDQVNQIYLEALEKSHFSLQMLKMYAEYKEETGNILMARDYWVRIKEKDPENAAEYDVHINRLTEQLPEEAR